MNRAFKSVIAGAGLMLALSSPAFAENGTSGMTGTGNGSGIMNPPGYTSTNSPVNGTRLGVTVPQNYTTNSDGDTMGINGYNGNSNMTNNGLRNMDRTTNMNANGNFTTRTGGNNGTMNGTNNAYRRYATNNAGVGNTNMTSQRLRAQAANTDNDMDWGWLGLLGLLGLAGLRNRNRERS
jgi:MYXO-CTERM domain-containing protein